MTKESQTCYKCKEQKPSDQFYRDKSRSSGLSSACKVCAIKIVGAKQKVRTKGPDGYSSKYYRAHKEQSKAHNISARNKKREVILEAKDKPCSDCSGAFHPCAMDLDHKDPTTKVAPVSQMIKSSFSMSELVSEIAKCDVVCSNCHRKRSYLKTIRHPLTLVIPV